MLALINKQCIHCEVSLYISKYMEKELKIDSPKYILIFMEKNLTSVNQVVMAPAWRISECPASWGGQDMRGLCYTNLH
jgi:hypothetical protein